MKNTPSSDAGQPAGVSESSFHAVHAVKERVHEVEAKLRTGVNAALSSGQARLKDFGSALDRLSQEQWTFAKMGRRLEQIREEGVRKVRAQAQSARRRFDEMPAQIVSAAATAGKNGIHELSSQLQKLAGAVAPKADANGSEKKGD
jgi:hypothetical protein